MTKGSAAKHVVVVTGGTRGLGLLTAGHWAALGSNVVVCSRQRDDAVAAARRLADKFGVSTFGAGVDVGRPADVVHFAACVEQQLGGADLVINNAAVLGPVGTLDVDDAGAWAAAIDINVVGSSNIIAAFLPQLSRSGRGRVVNLSGGGVGGPRPMKLTSAYVVSKVAIAALTEVLAEELAEHGVTINAIAPGPLSTDFLVPVIVAGPQVAGAELFAVAGERSGSLDEQAAGYLRLLDYVASDAGAWLSGRLLSARWETPELLEARRPLDDSDFRLRRIDDDLFTTATR